MIANHGQKVKYYHKITGCNSRLDQFNSSFKYKLKYLDNYSSLRNKMAEKYDENFLNIPNLSIPKRLKNSTHVFHQYTLKVKKEFRNPLLNFLKDNNIPAMIYYPVPLYKQEAFKKFVKSDFQIINVENLCDSVISLPIHTEIENSYQDLIIQKLKIF